MCTEKGLGKVNSHSLDRLGGSAVVCCPVTLCVSNCSVCVTVSFDPDSSVEEQVLWLGHCGEKEREGHRDGGWPQGSCCQVVPRIWSCGRRASLGLCLYGIEIPSSLKIKRLPACSNFLTFHYDRGWLKTASSWTSVIAGLNVNSETSGFLWAVRVRVSTRC